MVMDSESRTKSPATEARAGGANIANRDLIELIRSPNFRPVYSVIADSLTLIFVLKAVIDFLREGYAISRMYLQAERTDLVAAPLTLLGYFLMLAIGMALLTRLSWYYRACRARTLPAPTGWKFRYILSFAALAVSSWLGGWMPFSPSAPASGSFMLAVILALTMYGEIRKWKAPSLLAILALACSIFAMHVEAAAGAAYEYFNGTGRLRSFGLSMFPEREWYGDDPELRVPWLSLGCSVCGYDIEFCETHNTVLGILIKGLGPMKGSYTGSIPTFSEAKHVLSSGSTVISSEMAASGEITLEGRVFPLGDDTRKRITSELNAPLRYGRKHSGCELKAAWWKGGCIVLGITWKLEKIHPKDADSSVEIFLVDPSTSRIFCWNGEDGGGKK
ncbi:hypothetical protein HYR69_12220 [Candidatus Sumerlaeota bacterium]|nr:hypothetical protein [Candidatus Sumerlaeota bacterium]